MSELLSFTTFPPLNSSRTGEWSAAAPSTLAKSRRLLTAHITNLYIKTLGQQSEVRVLFSGILATSLNYPVSCDSLNYSVSPKHLKRQTY